MIDGAVLSICVDRFPLYSRMETTEQKTWWFKTFFELRDLTKEHAEQLRRPTPAPIEQDSGGAER